MRRPERIERLKRAEQYLIKAETFLHPEPQLLPPESSTPGYQAAQAYAAMATALFASVEAHR